LNQLMGIRVDLYIVKYRLTTDFDMYFESI